MSDLPLGDLPVIDCKDCGVCCLHMGFPAFNLTLQQLSGSTHLDQNALSATSAADLDRWQAMPKRLQDEILDQMVRYQPSVDGGLDGPCSWLDQHRKICRHHEHRPQVCRDFAVGGPGCLQWRRAKRPGR